MRIRNFILPMLIIIAMAGLVSAVATIVPTSNSVFRGNQSLEVTSTMSNATNCTVSGTSALSGGSFTVYAYNTSGTYVLNVTLASNGQYDAGDWSITGTCYNFTGSSEAITTVTGIDINNTLPVISSCTIESATASNTTATESTITFACTVQNATSCNVYWKDATANAMTTDYSDADCTFASTSSFSSTSGTTATCTLSGLSDSGSKVYADCTSGSSGDTSTTAHYLTTLEGLSTTQKTKKESIKTTQIVDKLQQNKKNLLLIVALVAIILIISAVVVINKKK